MTDTEQNADGEIITAAQTELLPGLAALLECLEADDCEEAVEFFRDIQEQIRTARGERDLQHAFEQLSLSAFVILTSPVSTRVTWMLDDILARAQLIAWTLSAAPRPH